MSQSAPTRPRLTLLLSLLTASLFLSRPGHAEPASFTPLGDLPGGDFMSTPRDISADGSTIVGYSRISAAYSEAFVWTLGGGMVGIGMAGPGHNSSHAHGISADATTIVGTSGGYPFRWTQATGMVGLANAASVFPNPTTSRTTLYAASGDGSVAVGEAYDYVTMSPESQWHTEAVYWTSDEGYVRLGFLPGSDGDYSRAVDVSDDGSQSKRRSPGRARALARSRPV